MEVYLDNSATTKCAESVIEKVTAAMRTDFGNPSSMHTKGMEAEQYIKEASEVIASLLKVGGKEIFYTSGGTESNNLAILGTAAAKKRSGMHLITTAVEHASVAAPMKHLEEQGYTVTYLPVNSDGCISISDVKEAVREDTILISMMYVNNEVGAKQPVKEVGAWLKQVRPDITFHVDAVQGFGKFHMYPKRSGIDLLSVSGHKIHGPKGVGFLYCSDKVKLQPILFGGGHQKGLRSGTENVSGIAGIGEASRLVYERFEEKTQRMRELRRYLIAQLSSLEGVTINGPEASEGAPHIVSASVAGIRSEVLLHSLEERGIYVSAGSACSSNKPTVSATLKAMGVEKDLLDSTLRFSFCEENTKEEVEQCYLAIKELLPFLRRYTRH